MEIPSRDAYSFGFTAGGLGLPYCQSLARLYLELGDWKAVREEALRSNALRQGRNASSKRVEREFRLRIQTLTGEQLEILAEGSSDAARSLALLAAFKRYPVIFDFCALKLKSKLLVFDTDVRPSDLDNFFAEVEPHHPEIDDLTDSTLAKVRQVMLRILAEGGILSGTDSPAIVPVPLSPEAARVIAADSPFYLQGYLIDEAEVALYADIPKHD